MVGRKLMAEALGTFWLVFGGCGSAILSSKFLDAQNHNVNYGIGLVGVAFAFGLTVLTMAYAIGHISGCHLNPAVSVGLCVAGRFSSKEVLPYIVAQLVGGLIGSGVLYVISSGHEGFSLSDGFAANGYGEHSPDKYSLVACLVAEAVLTFMFLIIILGATDKRAPAGFAPLAIGLGLTLINLIGIPVTNLSVNPARSTAPAVFVGGWALAQLWLFWVAPIAGAVVAGVVYRTLEDSPAQLGERALAIVGPNVRADAAHASH
jgi:aquaporin Z